MVDAGFVWTEPHSKRIKVKLTIQQEVSVEVFIPIIRILFKLVTTFLHSVFLCLGAKLDQTATNLCRWFYCARSNVWWLPSTRSKRLLESCCANKTKGILPSRYKNMFAKVFIWYTYTFNFYVSVFVYVHAATDFLSSVTNECSTC